MQRAGRRAARACLFISNNLLLCYLIQSSIDSPAKDLITNCSMVIFGFAHPTAVVDKLLSVLRFAPRYVRYEISWCYLWLWAFRFPMWKCGYSFFIFYRTHDYCFQFVPRLCRFVCCWDLWHLCTFCIFPYRGSLTSIPSKQTYDLYMVL